MAHLETEMKQLLSYTSEYFFQQHKLVLLFSTLLVAILITANYTLHLNTRFVQLSFFPRFSAYFFLFASCFSLAWAFQFLLTKSFIHNQRLFLLLLIAGPVLFALKMTFNGIPASSILFRYPWNEYLEIISKWPLKSAVVVMGIILLLFMLKAGPALPGLQRTSFQFRPYMLLIIAMVPLILLAATQPDFLHTYPKVKTIGFIDPYTGQPVLFKLLFELAYGIDFFTIELFFRGFLVLTFARFAGKDAILPMAVFYCTIHFGKPLGECITSYFGGLLLGIIAYQTGSIYGGLMVHLGIAWLMEAVASLAA